MAQDTEYVVRGGLYALSPARLGIMGISIDTDITNRLAVTVSGRGRAGKPTGRRLHYVYSTCRPSVLGSPAVCLIAQPQSQSGWPCSHCPRCPCICNTRILVGGRDVEVCLTTQTVELASRSSVHVTPGSTYASPA